MQINRECEICNSPIKNAVVCKKCYNIFCKLCIENWINSNKSKGNKISCPHCRTKDFNYCPCPEFDNIIDSASSILKCEKCLRIFFKNDDLISHKILCSQIKCKFCHEIFKDDTLFINHFEQEGRYHEKFLACNYLNINPSSYIKEENINNSYNNIENYEIETPLGGTDYIQKYKKTLDLIKDENKINPFKNNFKKNIGLININIYNKYKDYKELLNKELDIFYCNKINVINKEICSPGNILCPKCMKINQEYHRLKKYYFINSAGRVCTYNRKKVHCLCHFERFIKKGDKLFCPDLICYNNEICQPCQEINKIINFYLDEELLTKLKKRDEIYGY